MIHVHYARRRGQSQRQVDPTGDSDGTGSYAPAVATEPVGKRQKVDGFGVAAATGGGAGDGVSDTVSAS
eukprot:SAG22_NODE_1645_length_3901_cov_2.101262_3_plen_69_part_00